MRKQRVHKIVYRDTRYNIDFLYTAFVLDEEKIMGDYARMLELMDFAQGFYYSRPKLYMELLDAE